VVQIVGAAVGKDRSIGSRAKRKLPEQCSSSARRDDLWAWDGAWRCIEGEVLHSRTVMQNHSDAHNDLGMQKISSSRALESWTFSQRKTKDRVSPSLRNDPSQAYLEVCSISVNQNTEPRTGKTINETKLQTGTERYLCYDGKALWTHFGEKGPGNGLLRNLLGKPFGLHIKSLGSTKKYKNWRDKHSNAN